jgi:cytochrome bd ubiquinol oxidase subunit I
MALSLGFHIVFASISMVLPFLMAAAHARYLISHQTTHLKLTKAWSHGAAVLFATGAVSGTALSFQLGLLWPQFMEHAGPIIGMPFSLEGAAFFLEAIFFGLYLYGWNKLPKRLHFLAGVLVGVCGLASGVLVVSANGWMNSPTGFVWEDGKATHIDPWAALLNDAWLFEASHMVVAAVQATAFGAAGVHAWSLLRLSSGRDPVSRLATDHQTKLELHSAALRIILPVAVVASLIQPVVGDVSAKFVAETQPEKFAALEAHFHTEKSASLVIGGIPDEEKKTVDYALKIPYALSILAHGDPEAVVLGLEAFPPEDHPPVAVVHFAFQTMVGIGALLVAFALFWAFTRWRRPSWLRSRAFLWLLVGLSPLGFIALEAGWIVTEVGRQPWIVYKVMRTADAVTPVPGQVFSFAALAVLYLVLGVLSTLVLVRLFRVSIADPPAPDSIPSSVGPPSSWGGNRP